MCTLVGVLVFQYKYISLHSFLVFRLKCQFKISIWFGLELPLHLKIGLLYNSAGRALLISFKVFVSIPSTNIEHMDGRDNDY